MTTLSKRATPSQKKVLKIIAGAVKTSATVHPHRDCAALAESIAKRATGTLSGVFPEAFGVSCSGHQNSRVARRVVATEVARRCGAEPADDGKSFQLPSAERRHILPWRLSLFKKAILTGLLAAKREGDNIRMNTLADVMRLVKEIESMPDNAREKPVLGKRSRP